MLTYREWKYNEVVADPSSGISDLIANFLKRAEEEIIASIPKDEVPRVRGWWGKKIDHYKNRFNKEVGKFKHRTRVREEDISAIINKGFTSILIEAAGSDELLRGIRAAFQKIQGEVPALTRQITQMMTSSAPAATAPPTTPPTTTAPRPRQNRKFKTLKAFLDIYKRKKGKQPKAM